MRFQPGQSGNPAGRPPGSLNKKTLALEALFMDEAEETVKTLIGRAKEGHPAAMRLFMARALPTGRDRPLAIALPVIREPDDAFAAMEVVTAALAAGVLSVSAAAALINLIDRMLRLAERVHKVQLIRRADATAEATADVASDETAAAPAPAPALAAALAAAIAAAAAADPLYSPVNEESCRRDGPEAEPGRGGGEAVPVAAADAAASLYFPVNQAA